MRASRAFCAIACFSLACSRGGDALDAGDRGTGTATVTGTATETAAAAGADATPTDPFATAQPIKARSIGHTSFVLKLTLDGDLKAAYKPRSRLPLGDRRYRAEIAAYRLARALGLDNVPRAIPRSFDAASLRAIAGADFDAKALPDADGRIRGALVPWIERYEVLPLEQPAWRTKWEAWLTDANATIPDGDRKLARAVSTMLVFDYVTANWDRWSGANVAVDRATDTLLYVDNDGAFYETPPVDSLARQIALVRRVVRFSRGFVAALRALDEAKMRAAFGDESPGVPLLSDRVVAGADERRRTALAAIDARIVDAGENAALAFE